MAKKNLTPEQEEIKKLKKQRRSNNGASFIAIILAVALTVGAVAIAKSTASKSIQTSSNDETTESTTEALKSEMIIGEDGSITIIGDPNDEAENSEGNKMELSANPADWSIEEIVAVYKNAASKSHSSVESSQIMLMPKLVVNDGDGALGAFLKLISPAIQTVLKNNATTYGGVTGGYTKMVPEDVQSAKAYKEGDYIVIEMTMNEQIDGIYGDFQGGSVGHAINVLGNVATAVEQFPAFDIKFEEADIKVHYTNPMVKVRINNSGLIEKGTWSYDSLIYIRHLDVNGIMIDKADAQIDYIITIGGGF